MTYWSIDVLNLASIENCSRYPLESWFTVFLAKCMNKLLIEIPKLISVKLYVIFDPFIIIYYA